MATKKKTNLYTESIKDYITKNPTKAAEMLSEDMKNYFGFTIRPDDPDEEDKKPLKSFAPPDNDEGALITGYSAFNAQYLGVDAAQRPGDEAKLINRYREMGLSPECESAIDDIINEMICIDEEGNPINIVLDDVKLPTSTKNAIRDEFDYILDLFEFKQNGYDIIRKWYVDGRIYYHLMLDTTDEDSVKDGIQEVRYIDPRKIKKIKTPQKDDDKTKINDNILHKEFEEYYVYTEMGFEANPNMGYSTGEAINGLKIAKDSVAYAHSGRLDPKTGTVLSHLHKAIKPYNQLRMMEDSTVIYRITRAPERRIFYIDVGGLPPQAAEKYIANTADRFKNKLSYDISTGEMTNDRRYMTMLEDFFLGQRDGKGTNVDTLPGGQNLGEMTDVEYFRRKLYQSLNVPTSRLESESSFNLGRPQEITRDEVKFSKFIKRLRSRFVLLFEQVLERQLFLKGIIAPSEWEEIRQDIFYDFKEDNHFSELRDAEILTNRLGLLGQIHTYTTIEAGGYFSRQWIRKNVLKQDEKEIDEIASQIEDEKQELLNKGIDPNAATGMGGFGMGGMGAMGGMDSGMSMGGIPNDLPGQPEMQGMTDMGDDEMVPSANTGAGKSQNSTSTGQPSKAKTPPKK